MTNLFEKARAVAPKKTGSKKPEVEMVETSGLEILAEIDAMEKALKALKETLRPTVEAEMLKRFCVNSDNYKGKDGSASASLELRKRSSASGLSEAEQLVLRVHNISTKTIDGTFVVNEAYANDAKLLDKVSKALSKVPGLPEDFLSFDSSKARVITTDESIKEVYKLNDLDSRRQVLPIVGTLAIKPTTSESMTNIIGRVAEFLED